MRLAHDLDSPRKPSTKWALKMLLIGDAGVGKTDLMCSFADCVLIDGLRASVGSSFGVRQVLIDPVQVKLQIWNLNDTPRFDQLRRVLYKGSSGAIYVFDVTDQSSFKHISDWVREVHRVVGSLPAILIGNRREKGKRRQVSHSEGKALAKDLGIPYIETSARTAHQINEALENLVFTILEERFADKISEPA